MEIIKFVQFVQIAIVISCCCATFVKPPHLAAFRPPMQLKPFHKPAIYNFPMKPFFRQPHPSMFPAMIKPPFKVIPVLKPKLFMKPMPFSYKMMPVMIKKVKYMKVPKIPFRYLKPKLPPKYKLPTPVFRGNVVTGYRPPPSINRPRPRVRRPPTRIYRRPLSRPPTRIYRRPLSRPRPQHPNRSYIPPPETQPPRTYEPPTQPPVAYDRPAAQPPVSGNRPNVQPPVVYDRPPVQPPVSDNRPHVQPPVVFDSPPIQPSVSNNGPHVQPPVVNDRPPVQPSVPNNRPQSIPEQRRIQWLQTAHGGINFADDDDDNDDFDDYWEDKFDEFDDNMEDLLEKKTDGYYDNNDDNMLDDEIYENFEKMNEVKTNIARSREYLDDLIENGGRANRLTQQPTQQFQPGNSPVQPSKTNEDLIERQNKYQERYFEKQGNRMMQRGQQNQPSSIPAQPSPRIGDIVERQNKYQEKYFEDINNNGVRFNNRAQQFRGSNMPIPTSNHLRNLNVGTNKYSEKYFERNGNGFSQQNNQQDIMRSHQTNTNGDRLTQQSHQFPGSNMPVQGTNELGNRAGGRNKYNDKYFEMNGDHLPQQNNKQDIMRPQQSSTNRNLLIQQTHQFAGSNMPVQATNDLGNLAGGRNKYNDKYFERNGDHLPQQNNKQDIMRPQQTSTNRDRIIQQTHQFAGSNMPVQATNDLGNLAGGRNKYNDKYFERNGDHLPQQNNKQDIMRPQQTSTNRDRIIQQTHQFAGSNMPVQATNDLGNLAGGRNKYDDKYFERNGDNLAQQTFLAAIMRSQQTNSDGDLRMQNNEKYFDKIGDRQMQQLHRLQKGNIQVQQTNIRTGNGIENTLVTRQHKNFADNTENIQREQIIKYQKNNNKYLDNKDEFRRKYVKTLTETQNQFDIQRENHLFQRSSTIPRAKSFPSLKS